MLVSFPLRFFFFSFIFFQTATFNNHNCESNPSQLYLHRNSLLTLVALAHISSHFTHCIETDLSITQPWRTPLAPWTGSKTRIETDLYIPQPWRILLPPWTGNKTRLLPSILHPLGLSRLVQQHSNDHSRVSPKISKRLQALKQLKTPDTLISVKIERMLGAKVFCTLKVTSVWAPSTSRLVSTLPVNSDAITSIPLPILTTTGHATINFTTKPIHRRVRLAGLLSSNHKASLTPPQLMTGVTPLSGGRWPYSILSDLGAP